MIDINSVNEAYEKYRITKDRFHALKKTKWSYYQEHRKEIDQLYNEYLEIDDPQESKEFHHKHKVLRTHLIFEYLVQRYKFEYRRLFEVKDIFPENECILAVKNDATNEFYLYDLISEESIDVSRFTNDKLHFVIEGLTRSKSFIGCIDNSELPLIEVIEKDIRNKYPHSKNKTEENIATEIGLDLIKAAVFDNPKDNKKSNKQKELFKQKIDENKQRYDKGEISYTDYMINYYYYLILIEHDVEGIYLNAPMNEKEFVIEAYFILSSYAEMSEEYPYHERTCSSLINREILERKYKKTE